MERSEPSRARDVRDRVRRLREHAAAVSGEEPERIVKALLQVTVRLARPQDALARDLRAALLESSGLSAEMITWGLDTALGSLQPASLHELATGLPGRPHALVGVVLAGNVFVAALRALVLPLLAGAHVIAKAASHDGALARALKRALDDADAEIGKRLEVVQFTRDDHDASAALCARVDALSVYGDDSTVEHLRAQLRPEAQLIAHGHGLSAAYVAAENLRDTASARALAERLALDVAAYDQHGCLSPHFVLVDAGAPVTPDVFARLLADEGLPAIAKRLPPGPARTSERAGGVQWRAVAAVRGNLYDRHTHAVSFEAEHAPRPSPGGRLIAVHSCRDLSGLDPFGAHLKCLGVAADPATRAEVARKLAAIGGGYACLIGEMQTPPLDVHADGRPPLAGLRAL